MPLYKCHVPENSIDPDAKSKIAQGFTDIHCGITGAPRHFVHVMFFDAALDASKKGSADRAPYFIDGINRAGRSAEIKQQILDGLKAKFSEAAGVPLADVAGRIEEIPASHFMEEGVILPEPGEEGAEWFAASSAGTGS